VLEELNRELGAGFDGVWSVFAGAGGVTTTGAVRTGEATSGSAVVDGTNGVNSMNAQVVGVAVDWLEATDNWIGSNAIFWTTTGSRPGTATRTGVAGNVCAETSCKSWIRIELGASRSVS
jgi:hypothetical protein